jgi:GNAT superfamily N-acetyltransferase
MGFVAEEDAGLVLGVVVGPQNPEGYFRRLLKRRWWAFCASSAWALVKKPTIAPRLFRAVFYRGEAPPGPPRALLSSVAVAPEAQGKGIGAALVRRWVEEARARGAAGCYLTTDADNNEAVNRFYQKLGWTVESTYATPEGRRMNRYVLDFSPPRPQDTKTHEETA